ncbi:MAG: 16S rRNA (uracil(1498)-N(3))-methyltransferase [Chitinophagales bacterium]|nr:16S rRNA (uracil(1498)-N(3))-methyltransferase [Chitinophagales bacterium]MDW8427068.1 RsmE family RNA methyltransferase [Chitinophagales bacterium]
MCRAISGLFMGPGELFYIANTSDTHLLLDADEAHHCLRVLRHRRGHRIYLTDGKGALFSAVIRADNPRHCEVELAEKLQQEAPPKPSVHLAVAPTKNLDRFAYLLEKATEVGVTAITPLLCERSQRETVPEQRLRKIIISAMKQSGRLWLPSLHGPTSFRAFVLQEAAKPFPCFLAHCQNNNLPDLLSSYKGEAECSLLIGPEGDFSSEEIAFAEQHGIKSVSLGSKRLRTETAGLVASLTVLIAYAWRQSG